jgi:hypothetical protein
MYKRAWMTVSVAAGVLVPFLSGAANAASLTAFAIQGGNDSTANVSYTPGAGGGLSIAGVNDFLQGKVGQGLDSNASVTFTNMVNGTYSVNGSGLFDQQLNPGADTSSFIITDNTTHTVLLSGTLGTADLTGTNGASSGNVTLAANNVTYTGGTYFPATFDPNNGALAIEFTSTQPFVAGPTGLSAFTGVDGVTFSALNSRGPGGGGNGVPEPASTAPFAAGGLFLLGILLRKRHSRAC